MSRADERCLASQTHDGADGSSLSSFITGMATKFALLPTEQLDNGIAAALGDLGSMIGASRVGLGLASADGQSMTLAYTWSNSKETTHRAGNARHVDRKIDEPTRRWLEAGTERVGLDSEFLLGWTDPFARVGLEEVAAIPARWADGLFGTLVVGFEAGAGDGNKACPCRMQILPPFLAVLGSVILRIRERLEARVNHARQQAVLDGASAFVLISDRLGTITFASAAVERTLGRPNRQLLGTTIADLVHPHDQKAARRVLNPGSAGSAGIATIRLRHRIGTWRYIEAQSVSCSTTSDYEIVTSGRDVTDLIAAEEAIREKQAADSLLSGISSRFVRDDTRDFESNLLRSIEEVREFFALGRVSLWRSIGADRELAVTHESMTPGLGTSANRLPRLSPSDISALAPQLVRGEVVVCHDDFDPHLVLRSVNASEASPIRSLALVPMLTDGRLIGFINLVTVDEPITFTAEALYVLRSVGTIFTTALARHEADTALARRALHDPLTGLANRALLLDRLEHSVARARRLGGSVALLFIDLDGFKGINDTLGHAVGDQVLVHVAERLETTCREADTVARLGGDEFVVLAEGALSPEQTAILADRIHTALSRTLHLGGHDVGIACSIGIVVEELGHGAPGGVARGAPGAESDGARLLRKADIAMYRAKKRGHNGSEMFSDDMEKGAQLRFELIEDLRDVSFESGLRLVYQPVVRLNDGSVAGVEALVRWQHPTRGLLAPRAFIDLAEQTNTIHALGAWVIETAFAQLASWQKSGAVSSAAFQMAVNLSVRQLQDRSLTKHVQAAIDRHRIDPACIVFELTESVHADRNDMLSRMMELRDIGVKLAIDDFGTGYSSLAYIRELPVDELKIDRSFVQGLGVDERDGAVVKAILGMAAAIGLGVIAEGVETTMQVDALNALGCERAQGFYFGKGVPADELSFPSARSQDATVRPIEARSALPR